MACQLGYAIVLSKTCITTTYYSWTYPSNYDHQGMDGIKISSNGLDGTNVTRKEVTKQLVFDGLCSVNAKFILRV
jgi:hypothetical protein